MFYERVDSDDGGASYSKEQIDELEQLISEGIEKILQVARYSSYDYLITIFIIK